MYFLLWVNFSFACPLDSEENLILASREDSFVTTNE